MTDLATTDAKPPAGTATGSATSPAPLTRAIRSGLDRLRAYDRRRPLVWDAAVTAFWTVAAVLDYTSGGWRTVARDVTAPESLVLLMSLCFSLPLLMRRRHPTAVLLLMAPVSLLNVWTGAVVQAALLQLIPAFQIALRLPLRRLAAAGLVLCAPVAAGAARIPGIWDQQLVFVPLGVRLRRPSWASRYAPAATTPRPSSNAPTGWSIERDQRPSLAAAAERTRVAREMHDIVGHNLSVITLADGGAYAGRRAPNAASRRSSYRRHRPSGSVRTAPPPRRPARRPPPTRTAPRSRASPTSTPCSTASRAAAPSARPTGPGHPTPRTPGRQLTVYRIVQEALTNTLKHAGPTHRAPLSATVTLTYTPTHVDARITGHGNRTARPRTHKHGPPRRPHRVSRACANARRSTAARSSPGPLPAHGGWHIHLRLPLEDHPSVTTVLIADDQPLQRFGFRMLLETRPT